jgi:uncharacterized membrane protein YuzA (DUF378 family)
MKVLDGLTLALVIVGALNWGLVGIARFDLVAAIFGMSFGEVSPLTGIVYTLVAISGIYQAVLFKAGARREASLPAVR